MAQGRLYKGDTMIYLKRILTFLFVFSVFIALGLFITIISQAVGEKYGTWGLVGLITIMIIAGAIFDVKLDAHLKRKRDKAREDFEKELKGFLDEK